MGHAEEVPSLAAQGILAPDDFVGATFYIAQNVMIAFTLFFFMERNSVPQNWQSSMTVAGMVTGIAAWNYQYIYLLGKSFCPYIFDCTLKAMLIPQLFPGT